MQKQMHKSCRHFGKDQGREREVKKLLERQNSDIENNLYWPVSQGIEKIKKYVNMNKLIVLQMNG